MKKNNLSYFFVGLASLLWASTAAVTKLLTINLDSLQVVFYSSLFAFLVLLLIVLFQNKTKLIKQYTKRDYVIFASLGFIGVFLYRFFLNTALSLMPAQEAFIINYLWPVMVVIFAIIILKEKASSKTFLGIILSFCGVIIVITKGNLANLRFDSWAGILFALSGAIVYGLFSVLGKKKQYDLVISMMFYYLFALFYALVATLLFSEIPKISSNELLGLLWLGIFPSGLAFLFWFFALKYGDTAKMSNIIFLTPFLSLIYIYFLLGEKILVSSIIGLIIILIGILIQSTRGAVSKIQT